MAADDRPLILVIDDEPINLRVIEEGLVDAYRVRTVGDGMRGLDIAHSREPPDLILLDVMMPGIDGYEVCRRLKQDAATRDIPVIFVTTLSDADHEARGLDAGAVDYIAKPVNLRTMRARVRTHVELKQARERLRALSRLDGLTGIANRRAFDEALAKEWRRNLRDETPVTIVMCDIDHFKEYNDQHGHVAGDQCLQRVARAIAGAMRRPTDVAARFGGEEFAALLTNTDVAGGRRVAETICERVLKVAEAGDIPGGVSISCGVAGTVPTPDVESVDLVARADKKLYEAKSQGRNRVVS